MATLDGAAGLADPVIDGQAHFRSLMKALARPGSIEPLAARLNPPPPLGAGLAALALCLADHEAPLWLDPVLAGSEAVGAYLRFHTGAAIVDDPASAAFALVADFARMPPLANFAPGTDEYPDRSSTILVAVDHFGAGTTLELEGPGIRKTGRLAVSPWPDGMTAALAGNRALFPRGVELVLVAADGIAALPRTTRVREV